MHITYISLFPDIYTSFLETSLIKKAIDKKIVICNLVNPRDFCDDKHKQIDDDIYGGGAGMLMKAKPLIDAIENVIKKNKLLVSKNNRRIIFMSPSKTIFDQKIANTYSMYEHLIFVSGRYEWIDYRREQYMKKKYKKHFIKLSLGTFITLWGETPSMVVTEAIVRLIPGVIKEAESYQRESYSVDEWMNNLEYPQYTRPEELLGMKVPKVLLSGNHANIEIWRQKNMKKL